MAPSVPEEVNVFSIPHSRMKGLVTEYFEMIQATNFTNDVDLDVLLENLLKTFMEFKTHEMIENRYIMKRLKNKLKKLSIQNTAVCNCHKDDHLGQMMRFIKDGYKKKTQQDRMNYAVKLRQALEDFTKTFLPHMEEEEEVFQPLLLQYFSYDELRALKKKVIQQHLVQEQIRALGLEKSVEEISREQFSASSSSEDELEKPSPVEPVNVPTPQPAVTIESLPPELVTRILTYLSPKDLARCSQVSLLWNQLAYQPSLWKNILPVQWSQGDWSFVETCSLDDDDEGVVTDDDEEFLVLDDDADLDETESDLYSARLKQVKAEAHILMGLSKYVLPSIGEGVQKFVLANSKAVTNGLLNKMLQRCPNIEHLDLTQTRIGDSGLKCLSKGGIGGNLKTLILSGCVNISDATLVRLAMAMNQKNTSASSNNDVLSSPKAEGECCVRNKNHKKESSSCLCEQYYEEYNVALPESCDVVESWNNPCCNDRRRRAKSYEDVDEEKDGGNEKSHHCDSRVAATANAACEGCDCGKKQELDGRKQQQDHRTQHEQQALWIGCNFPEQQWTFSPPVVDTGGARKTFIENPSGYEFSFQGQCVGVRKKCKDRGQETDGVEQISSVEVPGRGGEVDSEETVSSDLLFPYNNWVTKDNTQLSSSYQGAAVGLSEEVVSNMPAKLSVSSENLHQHANCHAHCTAESNAAMLTWKSIEDCAAVNHHSSNNEIPVLESNPRKAVPKNESAKLSDNCESPSVGREKVRDKRLEHLDLSGCFQITDLGLRALAHSGHFPYLTHLDLSGCFELTGPCLQDLVYRCPVLAPDSLFYCDNIVDGPYEEEASGCQNTCCDRRVCCRSGV